MNKNKIARKKDILDKLEGKPDYKAAYYILMDYWDSLPDEEKDVINTKLARCGL